MLNPLSSKQWSEGASLADDGIFQKDIVHFKYKFRNGARVSSVYEAYHRKLRKVVDEKLDEITRSASDLSIYPIQEVTIIDTPTCQSCKSPMHQSDIYDGFDFCGGMECEQYKKEMRKVRAIGQDVEKYLDTQNDLDKYFTPIDITHSSAKDVFNTGVILSPHETWFIQDTI